MSNNTQDPVDDFNNSLESISKLRRSSLVSIFLMVFGIVIVTSSLSISVFKLRSMKELIGYYQNNYGPIRNGQTSLGGPADTYETLTTKLKTAQEQALELVEHSGIGGMPRSRPVAVGVGIPLISPKDVGWTYYGYKYDDDDRWYRPKFNNSGNENPLPPGSVITTVSSINIYENYIKFDHTEGWVNADTIAEVNPETKLKVLEVHIILERYYWVKVKLDNKQTK